MVDENSLTDQHIRRAISAVHEAGHFLIPWSLLRPNHHQLMTGTFVKVNSNAVREQSLEARGVHVIGCAGLPCLVRLAEVLAERAKPLAEAARRQLLRDGALFQTATVMAGPIAVGLILSKAPIRSTADWRRQHKHLLAWRVGDGWDVEQVRPRLGRCWRMHHDVAFGIADSIVRQHRPGLLELASALVKRGRVEGPEALRLLDKAAGA